MVFFRWSTTRITTAGIRTNASSTGICLYFQSCSDFCERWDQTSFDDAYATEPLETFEPMVREVFARKVYDPAIMQVSVVKGLPAPVAVAA